MFIRDTDIVAQSLYRTVEIEVQISDPFFNLFSMQVKWNKESEVHQEVWQMFRAQLGRSFESVSSVKQVWAFLPQIMGVFWLFWG